MPTLQEIVTAAAVDTSRPDWRTKLSMPDRIDFVAGQEWRARMTTSKGVIVIRLMPEVAPVHVTSFAFLAQLGFYDGLLFHRVIPGFMAQGGCPLGSGTGGPGYKFNGEYSKQVRHDRPGLLSMANAGPGTDGSQFFLTFIPTTWLDDKHTIFGEVVEGMETLSALEACGSESGRPRERLVMEKVAIEIV